MMHESKAVLLLSFAFCAAPGLLAQAKGGAPSRPTAPTAPTRSPAPVTTTGSTYPYGSPGNMNPSLNRGLDYEPLSEQDALRAEQQERLRRALLADQQKRIKSDTSQLLELTALYQHNLQEHGELTDADRKLLARIEKLAHDIKSRASGS